MNLYLYGYGRDGAREWLMVDMGVTFGSEAEPGIDVILPDIGFIEEERHNIAGLLESEGADWHDVVRTTCYLADFRYYDRFNEVRNELYAESGLDPLPASTCVEARLCWPELLVEIEAIASL